MTDDRRLIDDALRSVPVPPGLAETLQPEALFADDQLDRLLVAVTVPAGLTDRVRAAVGSQASRRRNGTIDLARCVSAGADGPQPATPMRLRERLGGGLLGLAREAASVAAALGLAGLLAVAGIEFSRRLEGPARGGPPPTPALADSPAAGRPVDRSPQTPPPAARGGREPVAAARATTGPADEAPPMPSSPPPEQTFAERQGEASSPESAQPVPRVLGAALWPTDGAGPAGPPRMVTFDVPGESRRRVPRVRGYDLAFEMTTGEHPFVDPGAEPSLAIDTPPLTLRTGGFEALVSGDPRARPGIRAEEVLAAVPARIAAAAGGPPVRLDVSVVRSPLAGGAAPQSFLLEVAVSAAAIRGTAADNAAPLDTVLVLDQAAAGDPAAWPRICRGLAAVAAQMAPADRVTVVLCGPRPRVAVQAADAAQLAAVAADLAWLPPTASSDLDAGLESVAAGQRTIVVAHASSLDGSRGRMREALAAWHAALSVVGGDTLACSPAGGTRFIVLDPATPSPSRRGEATFGRTGPDAVSIRRAMLRQVTGRDTLVAPHCELEVAFDPGQVARYRLIGHRQSAIESLADVRPGGIDLHAGETVRAVYEVVPRNVADRFAPARATVSWRAEGGRERIEAAARGAAADLGPGLPSPHGCEILLATGLGELAAGSGHLNRRQAAQLLACLERLAGEWRNRGDVTPFAAVLLESLEGRAGGRWSAR